MKRRLCTLALALTLFVASPALADSPQPQPNPHLGPVGTATMHGDAQSSDTTPFAGPRSATAKKDIPMLAACPTVLAGSDGMIVALCTEMLGRAPVIVLIDPVSAQIVAQQSITKGGLLGGVYAFLDNANRLVLVDGTRHLIKVAHARSGNGWTLFTDESIDLTSAIAETDSVVGLVPDWSGTIVMATAHATVIALTQDHTITRTTLGSGELITNSISASPQGVSIATTHALYMLSTTDGVPQVRWRQPYDRGSARKPGQLSWGTGSTPTFFGSGGSDYLTIVDNADSQANLLVFRASDGVKVCSNPVFNPGASGSENSPIGYHRSVVVANTYGYPYPAVPDGAGPSVPASARFAAGMQRFDVRADESGCDLVWSNTVASAAVPRWSIADGRIYTIERSGEIYRTIAVDGATGKPVWRRFFGFGFGWDSLQMVGSITPDGAIWQGRLGGITKTYSC